MFLNSSGRLDEKKGGLENVIKDEVVVFVKRCGFVSYVQN